MLKSEFVDMINLFNNLTDYNYDQRTDIEILHIIMSDSRYIKILISLICNEKLNSFSSAEPLF